MHSRQNDNPHCWQVQPAGVSRWFKHATEPSDNNDGASGFGGGAWGIAMTGGDSRCISTAPSCSQSPGFNSPSLIGAWLMKVPLVESKSRTRRVSPATTISVSYTHLRAHE